MGSPALPAEPIVALDELQSEEARNHPLSLATETIVESFASMPAAKYLAKGGEEREYMRALVELFRRRYRYEVHEAHDFKAVALVREVPEPAAEPAGPMLEELEGGGQPGNGSQMDVTRAEASANIEMPRGVSAGIADEGGPADLERLRTAVKQGSVGALLDMGLPWLEAELLVHVKPERLEDEKQLEVELARILEEYMQGPLLHIHFLAVLPQEQRNGMGHALLQHLERMADAEGRQLYLETTSEASRRLYLRHGFRDVEQVQLGGPGSGIVFYCMAHPPSGKLPTTS